MKAIVFWVATIGIFGVTNGMIARKEAAIRQGITMIVPLAPRDPRSLMQGDYMALRYDVPFNVSGYSAQKRGQMVVKLNAQGVVQFLRIYSGEPLAEGEHLLRFTRKKSGTRVGPTSFFFQEGYEPLYRNAKYGELKVSASGESILVGLRNADLSPAGPATDSTAADNPLAP